MLLDHLVLDQRFMHARPEMMLMLRYLLNPQMHVFVILTIMMQIKVLCHRIVLFDRSVTMFLVILV